MNRLIPLACLLAMAAIVLADLGYGSLLTPKRIAPAVIAAPVHEARPMAAIELAHEVPPRTRERDRRPDLEEPRRARRAEPLPGKRLGRYGWTYYWLARQGQEPAERATRVLRDKNCKPIARVSTSFLHKLRLEGGGRLADGRTVGAAGRCTCDSLCYKVADARAPFGVGTDNRPLSPFRSVAVDRSKVRIGKWLYIAELDGMRMPGRAPWGGFVHDGCVIADDVGGGVRGSRLDFFAADQRHYDALMATRKLTRVTVHDGERRCRAVASREKH